MKHSSIKFKIGFTLLFLCISVTFLAVSSCNGGKKNKTPEYQLTAKEQRELKQFLNFLLFENHGAFVLLGSKPMSLMTLIDFDQSVFSWNQKLAEMNEEEREHWHKIMQNSEKPSRNRIRQDIFSGCLVWQRLCEKYPSSRFLTAIHSQGEGSGFYNLFFVDIAKTSSVLAKNYTYFKKITEQEFDPIEIVYELQNPDSIFWSKVFEIENHLGKGLLFGFGEENAHFFANQYGRTGKEDPRSQKILNIYMERSFHKEIAEGKSSLKNFNIPLFGSINRSQILLYEREKEEIRSYYKRKDLIQATLDKIALSM